MKSKVFRIVKIVGRANKNSPYVIRYKIEQRFTFLSFIHWWGSPKFAPPHLFVTANKAFTHIICKVPDAVVYDDNLREK